MRVVSGAMKRREREEGKSCGWEEEEEGGLVEGQSCWADLST